MTIGRKVLIPLAALVAVLFVVALPLGDSHHGLGAHHKLAADLGSGVWAAFLISAGLLIVFAVVAAVQMMMTRTRGART